MDPKPSVIKRLHFMHNFIFLWRKIAIWIRKMLHLHFGCIEWGLVLFDVDENEKLDKLKVYITDKEQLK